MVSPEDLSVEHSRELARNRTDMRFMEDDEEKAYSWIRFWCEDECKAVKDLKYQKVKLRHRAEAKKAILKTLEKAASSWDGIIAKLESNEPLDKSERDMFSKLDDEESSDPNDIQPPNIQKATLKRAMVEEKREKHRQLLLKLEENLASLDHSLREAEKARDNAWNHNQKTMKDGKTRMQLSTEHTKNYIIRFVLYPGYYRELPQMRTNWIGKNLMSVWGGVSDR